VTREDCVHMQEVCTVCVQLAQATHATCTLQLHLKNFHVFYIV